MIPFSMQGRHRSGRFPLTAHSRRRSARPSLEALEGRVVLNASSLDTTFGTGGVAQTPSLTATTQPVSYDYNSMGVQSTGKVVVAEARDNLIGTSDLLVRRYNTNGSIDTTFGTNGQSSIPLPKTTSSQLTPIPTLTIDINNNVVVAVNTSSTANFVARLTAAGQLDTTFGTNGAVTLPSSVQFIQDVTIQGDNKILITGGEGLPVGAFFTTSYQLAVVRLTTTGTLDTTFNGTGQLTYSPTSQTNTDLARQITAVAPSGQIYVGTEYTASNNSVDSVALTRINATGTIDTTYGTAGSQNILLNRLSGMGVQPTGKVVLTGTSPGRGSGYSVTMLRLNTDGTGDTTFVGSLTGTETTGIGPRLPFISAMTVESDGSILLDSGLNLAHFLATGAPDRSFGLDGLATIQYSAVAPAAEAVYGTATLHTIAVTSSGAIVAQGRDTLSSTNFLVRLLPKATPNVANDYDSDGKSDIAAYLPSLATLAIRPSSGGSDVLTSFGQPGAGNSVPAPGDYDGDGITDTAVYLAALGELAYRPSDLSTTAYDSLTKIGTAGTGNAIPTPGDYDGDGKTDDAVYSPATGAFTIKLTGGGGTETIPFGQTGAGNSIPAPGDYDGDGKTDLAVYLPSLGQLIYRPSTGGSDVVTVFGNTGAGASIPTPGDYDGDGKTDIAVYLPSLGIYAYRPSSGGADVLQSYGQVGAGASIPAPGDYDGDGKTDIAVYIPSLAQFIYRPSTGGSDLVTVFGNTGTGATIPAASIPYAQPSSGGGTGARGTGAVTPASVVYIPLTDEMTNPTPTARKKTTGTA